MKSLGNLRANARWNPNEARNPPPTNMEQSERDSELEKYIRAKYEHKRFIERPLPKADNPTPKPTEPRPKSTPLPPEPSKIAPGTTPALNNKEDSLFGSTLQYRPASSAAVAYLPPASLSPPPAPPPVTPAPAPTMTPNHAFLPPAFSPAGQYPSATFAPSLNHLQQAPQMSPPVWAEMVSLQTGSPSLPVQSSQTFMNAAQLPTSQYGLLPSSSLHTAPTHYGLSPVPSFPSNTAPATMNPNLSMMHPGTSINQGFAPVGSSGWYPNQIAQAGPYTNQHQPNVVEMPMSGGFSQSQPFQQQFGYPQQYMNPSVVQPAVAQSGFVNTGQHPYAPPQQQPQYQQTYKWTD